MKKKSLKIIIASAAIVTVLPVSNIRVQAENLQSHAVLLNKNVIGTARVKVSGLRIRKDAGLNADNEGHAEYGKSYSVYDTKTADGYTWYQIGDDEWIADNGGDWLDYNTTTASSTSTTKIGSVTIKVNGLRIRTDATTSSSQTGHVQSGKTYDVYEKKTADGYTWYRIGDNQWIADENGGWTDYTDGTAQANTGASQSQSAGTKIGTATVKVNGLRIRSIAGTNGNKVGTAQNGKTYDVYETKQANGFTWYRIGVNQWIADQNTNWVTYSGAGSTTKPTATPAAKPSATPISSTTGNKIGTVKVNVYGLNIRNSASTSTARVGQAQYGKTYDVFATKNAGGYTWYQIGNAQWIAGTSNWLNYQANGSAAPAKPAATATPAAKPTSTPAPVVTYIGTAKVVVSGLRIRSDASTSSGKVGTAVNGRTYNVISKKTSGGYTWYQIDNNQWIADTNGRWIVYAGKGETTQTKAQTTTVSKSARNPYYGGWSNCTWGAWQLVYNNLGIALPSMGNAGNWLASAQRLGYGTGSEPRVGAVAVYSMHVAYVVDYQPWRSNPVEIEEGGFNGGHNIRWVSAKTTGTQPLRGYIYLK